MFTINQKKALRIAGALLLLIVLFYGFRALTLRDFARQSQSQILSQLSEARRALASLDASHAETSLVAVNEELLDLEKELARFGVLGAVTFWDKITDTLRGMPSLLQDVVGISGTAIHINEDLRFLKEHGLQLFFAGGGDELTERLSLLQQKLGTLARFIDRPDLRALSDATLQKEIVALRKTLTEAQLLITACIAYLNPTEPNHLLVLFQNESELRPGGGFLGSYAHLTIHGGSVQALEVRDIYDPDGQLDINMMPPAPLQRITRDWEARDANWFFNVPDSLRRVISFLGQSKIYSEQRISFSGAIAVNTKVLGDILALIGPIELEGYNTTLTSDSFLRALQREVEAGENKKKNQPKKIVQELVPIVLEQMQTQASSIHAALFSRLQYHIERKNIMFFFEDRTLQQQLTTLGVSGAITPTPVSTSTVGDYLAVVSANIAGGKSDYVTHQTINLYGTINASGTLTHTLTITRAHHGANENDWWYRAPNKTYTQIYLPLGSRVTASAGALPLPKPSEWDYRGYQSDPLVVATQNTRRVFPEYNLERFTAYQKAVFGGWFTTMPGTTSTLTMTYKHPKRFDDNNRTYVLAFDKQSGAHTSFQFSLEAPAGFVWAETNTPLLSGSYEDPRGKEIIRGTLVAQSPTPVVTE